MPRACLFIDALWSPAGKGLTSGLSFMMSNCEVVTFTLLWCLMVSNPALCPLSYVVRLNPIQEVHKLMFVCTLNTEESISILHIVNVA